MHLNHTNSQTEIIKAVTEALNKHLDYKSMLSHKIRNTYGGEKMAYIKRYNGSFITPWKT